MTSVRWLRFAPAHTHLAELSLEIDFQGLQLASQFSHLVVARLHLLTTCNNLPIHLLNLKSPIQHKELQTMCNVSWIKY